jgi:hypothetical protein
MRGAGEGKRVQRENLRRGRNAGFYCDFVVLPRPMVVSLHRPMKIGITSYKKNLPESSI